MPDRSPNWKDKITAIERVVWHIRSGDRVFIGTACAAPWELVHALEETEKRLRDVQLIHYVADRIFPAKDGVPTTRFKHKVFYVGMDEEKFFSRGEGQFIDLIPIAISRVPRLFQSKRFPIDVALIQTTRPDDHGYVSLGVSVDITKAAVENAKMVIAQINPRMPWTWGDSCIHVEDIDYMVEVDRPITPFVHPKVSDDVSERIARYIASKIEDGSTLQVEMGRYTTGALGYLDNRRDLGIHSDVITDEVIDLIEKGVVTGKEKTQSKKRVVTSYCMGTEKLYKYVHQNPMFDFRPIDEVCRSDIISRNRKMVSINQAWAIDLMGQVCSGQFDGNLYGGISAKPDFIKGAADSEGGRPIICLESTYIKDGVKQSRIRPMLKEGEGVTVSRADVHYVVTEWGIEHIFGKSIQERAIRLIQVADPEFRDWLMDKAKEMGYVPEDYVLESKSAYPEHEERIAGLKDGRTAMVRPAKASDFSGMQDLFYHHLPMTDIETRFHTQLSYLPESKYNFLTNVDYETTMAFVAVTGEPEHEIIVGNSAYAVIESSYSGNESIDLAEFGYIIHPEWQGAGLGTILKYRMIEYAKKKGVKGYYEEFIETNEEMKALAKKSETAKITYANGWGRAETLF